MVRIFEGDTLYAFDQYTREEKHLEQKILAYQDEMHCSDAWIEAAQ